MPAQDHDTKLIKTLEASNMQRGRQRPPTSPHACIPTPTQFALFWQPEAQDLGLSQVPSPSRATLKIVNNDDDHGQGRLQASVIKTLSRKSWEQCRNKTSWAHYLNWQTRFGDFKVLQKKGNDLFFFISHLLSTNHRVSFLQSENAWKTTWPLPQWSGSCRAPL